MVPSLCGIRLLLVPLFLLLCPRLFLPLFLLVNDALPLLVPLLFLVHRLRVADDGLGVLSEDLLGRDDPGEVRVDLRVAVGLGKTSASHKGHVRHIVTE